MPISMLTFLSTFLFAILFILTNHSASPTANANNKYIKSSEESILHSETNNVIQNHSLWDSILKDNVYPNKYLYGVKLNAVDYVSLRRDPRFPQYLNMLANWDMTSVKTIEDELALYINAYNAWTIYIVTDNPCKIQFGRFCYPIKSVRDVGTGSSTTVWDLKIAVLGTTRISLNDIEAHLRKLNYPQIHACIVSACISCSDLQIGAYLPEIIYNQMDESMRNFLNNPTKGYSLDEKKNRLTLSQIFEWYTSDFIHSLASNGTQLIDFIIQYAPSSDQAYLIAHRNDFVSLPPGPSNVTFMSFNWRLNQLESL